MTKLFLFYILWRVTGNPILAVIVLLVVYYFIDRRYIGLLPNVFRPFTTRQHASKMRYALELNPHDLPAKQDLARTLIQMRKYARALPYLQDVDARMPNSADVLYELGLCYLKLGQLDKGKSNILRALELDPHLRYGEPYLKLGEALAATEPEIALEYIEMCQQLNHSSCEAYFIMGQLLTKMGQRDKAREAYAECQRIYKSLPSFKRKMERRWALLAMFH